MTRGARAVNKGGQDGDGRVWKDGAGFENDGEGGVGCYAVVGFGNVGGDESVMT
jgi:hypothetical protein